jgi:hypothetical protein
MPWRSARAASAALVAGLAGLVGLAACAGAPRDRALYPPGSYAHPEPDPALRGSPQGSRALDATEMVAVRLGRDASGNVTLLEVLSPALTPEEQQALIRAFARGEWRRATPVSPATETWVENIVRSKP